MHAQVLNDSLHVDSGYVFNVTAKMETSISVEGYFDILVEENDTLLVSSLAFKSIKLVLKDEDLKKSLLIVKLDTFTNQLKEVLVPKTRVPYLGSKQEIIDKPYFDDAQSTAKNSTTPFYGIENGFNFIKVGRMIGDLFAKRKDSKGKLNYYENFQEAAFKTVSLPFFTKSLRLKEDEIGLFLIFCENDVKAKRFLAAENKFSLIDFVISKNEEYKRIAIFAI
ncbi:hypothetical protein QO200_02345 [Flavobacterium sp. Arc3]|uniref:hypothetical protein n=1 Tax=Flavobacterium sp. Arc3 TaxID=3046686 RepID=UPI00352FEDA8